MDERTNPGGLAPARGISLVTSRGARITVRPVRPDDLDGLRQLFAGMSIEHRLLRFFQAIPTVHPALLRPLVDVDHHDHLAWLAFDGTTCIGEARLVRDPRRPDHAEVAFAVAPAWHRRGVARTLVETLGLVGRAERLTTMTATVAGHNHRSASFLRSLGMRFRWEGGDLEGEGPLPDWTGSPSHATALLERHRQAATPALAPAA
jgi:RimJ/RimL family protein N-acetyltransferase